MPPEFFLLNEATRVCKPKYGFIRSRAPDSCCIQSVPLRIAHAPLENRVKEGCSYSYDLVNLFPGFLVWFS